AAAQQALYKKYAGCIVAFGRVAKEPFQTEAPGWESLIGEALGMPKLIIFSFACAHSYQPVPGLYHSKPNRGYYKIKYRTMGQTANFNC
ncbi:MAG: hypothetical protein V8T00_00665, partial [Oscillospiraceae bacterium]